MRLVRRPWPRGSGPPRKRCSVSHSVFSVFLVFSFSGRLAGWLAGRLAGRLAGWLAGWLGGWLGGWLAVWRSGRLAGTHPP